MRIAVLADVHANLAALRSVLAELDQRGVDRILCLGDFVGYHAEPNECIELLAARGCQGVMGNHDLGALGTDDPHTSRIAAQVQRWTAERLTPSARGFLEALPARRDLGWGCAVHGCFTNPAHVTGYVTPTTAAANLRRIAELHPPPWLALCGHTHMPALYSEAWPDERGPSSGAVALPRTHVVLANPGSVGQPRDGDPRASFGLLDEEAWSFQVVRVAYDPALTLRRLREVGFDPSLGQRLQEGR